ncbi:hypothetical protein AGABI2DRAFT_117460 [Agaricus bisporus var. bisporus H97]|uniref:hypothetical protein n=1 Tax=Agaricus bisporus var. bisporus (strain H97 / ATCC MYA-4626 / FGSC 10389) TaxID=936046 RepID=UPI00029F5FF4|nr:hypothetical protein AGABI2DRAFT_117460 [Agaricus bisporus var. bisporus H97]EKV48655.1 hypothetical protein AGABI2DRAFT_117460 [Agaricus bisporus var. bisporus H97]
MNDANDYPKFSPLSLLGISALDLSAEPGDADADEPVEYEYLDNHPLHIVPRALIRYKQIDDRIRANRNFSEGTLLHSLVSISRMKFGQKLKVS